MRRIGPEGGWPDEEPFDAAGWLAAGITASEAAVWRRWRIPLATARAWRAAGVADGLQAAQWSVAGVDPGTVEQWRAAGVDAAEAVRCRELGYTLDDAREFRRRGLSADEAFGEGVITTASDVALHLGGVAATAWVGGAALGASMRRFHDAAVPPALMRGYLAVNWLDDEALAWASQHIEAVDARLWRVLDLTPSQAGRLVRAGRRPDEVIREWWRAGIPHDEVAAWLAAGLSAGQAAAQRARGVTAEQAARRPPGSPGHERDDPGDQDIDPR